jgi:hypothetical protein
MDLKNKKEETQVKKLEFYHHEYFLSLNFIDMFILIHLKKEKRKNIFISQS